MVRVTKFRAEDALSVLEAARDNNDAPVIAACIRVRQGWMLGRRVARADLDLIAEFVE
jgi:uncharacterized radical SAM superfamily protein